MRGGFFVFIFVFASACGNPSSTPSDAPSIDGPHADGHVDGGGSGGFTTETYLKASNTGLYNALGYAIAISQDGNTLVVGSPAEATSGSGIDPTPDRLGMNSGAVYVYTKTGSTWAQQAFIKASGAMSIVDSRFGTSVALSADGNTLAVGAPMDDSNATGIGGDEENIMAPHSGAVYVFTRTGTTWSFQTFVKASNTDVNDQFGWSVALSGTGTTLAVGAQLEDSAAVGIGGDQADNTAVDAGAVYVFAYAGAWTQQAYIKASNTGAGDGFGGAVALSSDGNTLAVTAVLEASSATGIGGTQSDNSAAGAGAAYVFSRSGTTWAQQAYVKASNTEAHDLFGSSVTLSGDGNKLAVGAYQEDSAGSNQADNSAFNAGAAYVFARAGTTWSQQAYIKASNPDVQDNFGLAVALSTDGSTLAVGAPFESGSAINIGGNQSSNAAPSAGAVYVMTATGSTWGAPQYVKASNTDAEDEFGWSVALSSDGSVLAAGAVNESSAATGVGGNQQDNNASMSGAAYVIR